MHTNVTPDLCPNAAFGRSSSACHHCRARLSRRSPATGRGSRPAPARAADHQQGAQATDAAGAGDIVVTARRRSERLFNTPMAITAFTGEALPKQGAVRYYRY